MNINEEREKNVCEIGYVAVLNSGHIKGSTLSVEADEQLVIKTLMACNIDFESELDQKLAWYSAEGRLCCAPLLRNDIIRTILAINYWRIQMNAHSLNYIANSKDEITSFWSEIRYSSSINDYFVQLVVRFTNENGQKGYENFNLVPSKILQFHFGHSGLADVDDDGKTTFSPFSMIVSNISFSSFLAGISNPTYKAGFGLFPKFSSNLIDKEVIHQSCLEDQAVNVILTRWLCQLFFHDLHPSATNFEFCRRGTTYENNIDVNFIERGVNRTRSVDILELLKVLLNARRVS